MICNCDLELKQKYCNINKNTLQYKQKLLKILNHIHLQTLIKNNN